MRSLPAIKPRRWFRMSNKGRKPLPAAMIDTKQSKQKKDDIQKRKQVEEQVNPSPKSKLPTPSYLSPLAKKEWRRIMKLYEDMDIKILSDLDKTPLVMYCEAVAIYQKCQEKWKQFDSVMVGSNEAQRRIDNCFNLMNKQIKIINDLAEQLCLTPIARAKMGMIALNGKEKKQNPISEIFDT